MEYITGEQLFEKITRQEN